MSTVRSQKKTTKFSAAVMILSMFSKLKDRDEVKAAELLRSMCTYINSVDTLCGPFGFKSEVCNLRPFTQDGKHYGVIFQDKTEQYHPVVFYPLINFNFMDSEYDLSKLQEVASQLWKYRTTLIKLVFNAKRITPSVIKKIEAIIKIK